MLGQMHSEKALVAKWFTELRDQIVAAFETLEDTHQSADQAAGRFEMTPTKRKSGGGGEMSVMRGGRVFEKVGVNISTVHGTLGDKAQKSMAARGVAGLVEGSSFWASGISLVAHMQNPHVPAVHMNTRMFWTPSAWWFGGGSDLNPAVEYASDTTHFHAVLKNACDYHSDGYYAKFKAWADEYFYAPHRGRARGVGGIFYDDLNSADWQADFAFTKSVGAAFLPAFLPLVEQRKTMPWGQEEKDQQLVHRGLYAEYNLVYDRGTRFGLETGHDATAVLMSLPPLAKWI